MLPKDLKFSLKEPDGKISPLIVSRKYQEPTENQSSDFRPTLRDYITHFERLELEFSEIWLISFLDGSLSTTGVSGDTFSSQTSHLQPKNSNLSSNFDPTFQKIFGPGFSVATTSSINTGSQSLPFSSGPYVNPFVLKEPLGSQQNSSILSKSFEPPISTACFGLEIPQNDKSLACDLPICSVGEPFKFDITQAQSIPLISVTSTTPKLPESSVSFNPFQFNPSSTSVFDPSSLKLPESSVSFSPFQFNPSSTSVFNPSTLKLPESSLSFKPFQFNPSSTSIFDTSNLKLPESSVSFNPFQFNPSSNPNFDPSALKLPESSVSFNPIQPSGSSKVEAEGDEEYEDMPKVVEEEDTDAKESLFFSKCVLYMLTETDDGSRKEWTKKGVGTAYVQKKSGHSHVFVRADVSTGLLLLNTMLSDKSKLELKTSKRVCFVSVLSEEELRMTMLSFTAESDAQSFIEAVNKCFMDS
ncbi:DNA-directed RNA polymerase II subunit RPB1-like [Octopus sinensis]|uniref:DNA-directed RNA polymerase II subunit RPB1-like n=1 Tax=Octopus sinensis TaxID=2607531 RepID=A0A6P7TQF9_9MOLL|nr:DNA-directed RNA polymerase II subunit RPB1-like [Octopus sinensis]